MTPSNADRNTRGAAEIAAHMYKATQQGPTPGQNPLTPEERTRLHELLYIPLQDYTREERAELRRLVKKYWHGH